MQRERAQTAQFAPAITSLAVALFSSLAFGVDFALAEPTEVVVEKSSISDVGLVECQTKLILSVGVSQARLFTMQNKIVRSSVADPGIAEPIVVCENQLYIRGRSPGTTCITLWDDAGAVIHMEIRVEKNRGIINSTISAFRNDIDQYLLPSGSKSAVSVASPKELLLMERGTKPYVFKTSRNVDAVSRTPPQPRQLPTEDTLTFHFGKREEKILIRSGFNCDSYKPTKVINLLRSQSRIFQTKNGIASTTISEPGIAEPVAVSKQVFVLLGKAPGKSVLVLHDELGNEEAYNILVRKNSNQLNSTINALRKIFLNKILRIRTDNTVPVASSDILELAETDVTHTITLECSHQKMLKTPNSIARIVVSDPTIAEPLVVSSTEIAMRGKAPGTTTLFIWDHLGNVSARHVKVKVGSIPKTETLQEVATYSSEAEVPCALSEIECWTGSRKVVVSVRDTSISSESDPILSVISIAALPKPKFCDRSLAIKLNNEGVRTLATSNYNLAIRQFQSAIKADPTYRRPRANLGIAYNNLGLHLHKRNPVEAMRQFHNAIYLDPENATTVANAEGLIRFSGRDPKNFEDRVDLGDQAKISGDIAGSIIEYEAALKIRDDPAVKAKLHELNAVEFSNNRW